MADVLCLCGDWSGHAPYEFADRATAHGVAASFRASRPDNLLVGGNGTRPAR